MQSLRCPITHNVFQDPVICSDGHTYERQAITEWLRLHKKSPMTQQPMNITTSQTNSIVKNIIDELNMGLRSSQNQHRFKLDVDIKRTAPRPLFQAFGKFIYEVEWIKKKGPQIILLKIDGAKATREASFYVQLSCHPYIVRTFGVVDSNPGSLMLLQERAPMGDLAELLRENHFKPNEKALCEIFIQLCEALSFLSYNSIVHGDLACRNVLVFQMNATEPSSNLVKLTDFGLTRASSIFSVVDSSASSTMTVVPVRYAAPEILARMDGLSYSEKSDVYTMGVLMWEACSQGVLPYSSAERDQDVRNRKLNDERLNQPLSCSPHLWTIINQCWHRQPQDRPDFRSLKRLISVILFTSGSK
ncbi:unnamed protein product [Rotaria sp. Silwood2]|nr:unnamed protein product [Rotaria sp. Silwood2]CAF2862123.1 unnamed protein product [Rotaria sp. Silwood2]CAF3126077.1 unnamed protein product [Rotaria sp. Silwood2]CAF3271752.1 unnamed protein product [Rotaria sp. Silwood2]CAF4338294.1 unnamed protein product [Rotaria sp. Silwood2]